MPVKPIATFKLKFDDGRGGLCYNPNNQRKTFKIILPNKYTEKHKKIELWNKEEFFETLYRAIPNEYDNRMRFYGKKKVTQYPKNITLFLFLKSGKIGSVVIKNPKIRYD